MQRLELYADKYILNNRLKKLKRANWTLKVWLRNFTSMRTDTFI